MLAGFGVCVGCSRCWVFGVSLFVCYPAFFGLFDVVERDEMEWNGCRRW